MKKILKKSFEDFVKGYDNSSAKKVILTGDLYKDLDKYFFAMVCRGVFYALPKGYALKNSIFNNHFSKSLEIELLVRAPFYSIMTCSGHFLVSENGDICEWIYRDDDIVMQRFILPMRELVKQMQQYYIDHNLVGDKKCYVNGLE